MLKKRYVKKRVLSISVEENEVLEDAYALRFKVGLDHLEAEGGHET